MTDPLKPWQLGIPLETLLAYEARFASYNATVLSPFSAFKKHNIASALDAGSLVVLDHTGTRCQPQKAPDGVAFFTMTKAKVRSPIRMFPDVIIGYKEPGDTIIDKLVFTDPEATSKYLRSLDGPTWLYLMEESDPQREVARVSGFSRIGVHVNTFSDIFGVYFKGDVVEDDPWGLAISNNSRHPSYSKFND